MENFNSVTPPTEVTNITSDSVKEQKELAASVKRRARVRLPTPRRPAPLGWCYLGRKPEAGQ